MHQHNPTLFIEINESSYIFVAGEYDEDKNLKIIEKIISPNTGIDKNKFVSIEAASETIKKNVEIIENKLNCIFKDLILIIENFNYSSVSISGSKKLNGSQVVKENISYILNSLKFIVTETENQKTILQIFNSKYVLDGVNMENLPIGLFGNFYNHELTFFLITNNDLKNINQVFKKSNLELNKIVLKSFTEGTQLINQDSIETFFKIKINKESSNISFFYQSSFRYSENFNFGTDIIFKDIEKICSIDSTVIINFLLNEFNENKKFDDNEFLDKKYFTDKNYRKIRKKLIIDIINARINEIMDLVFSKNINLQSFKKNNIKTYIMIKDKLILNKFQKVIASFLLQNINIDLNFIDQLATDLSIVNTSNLSIFGWKKEAIPIVNTKKSLIAKIFKSIFG